MESNNSRKLAQSMTVKYDQLKSLDKRSALFHTKVNDFELVWEGSLFNADFS